MRLLKCAVLGYLLLGLIFTDAETKLLPDAMTLPGLALGIGFSLVVPVNDLASRIMPGLVSPAMSSEISWRLWSLADSLLGAAVGASFLYGAAAIYLRARGVEGMGFGDVKLMAMIGAFLGTKLTVLTIFAASLAGSLFGLSTVLAVWMKRTRRIQARGTVSGISSRECPAARLAIRPPGAPLLRDAVWRVSRQHGNFVVPVWRPAPALVLEGAVSLLMNPMVLRMGLLMVAAIAAFGLGLFTMRRLRKNLVLDQESLNHAPMAAEGLPVHAYHAVIQQLKQQKHELATQQLSDRRKAKASDTLSSTILSNLSCGVLFFNTSGLVRQANAAARKLLGFASPVGLHVSDLFRTATLHAENPSSNSGSGSESSVERALAPALAGMSAVRGLVLDHRTRDGENHVLEVSASPVLGRRRESDGDDACADGQDRDGAHPPRSKDTSGNLLGTGTRNAQFPDDDRGIRSATGLQPGPGTGAPVGRQHRPRSGAVGPDDCQFSGGRPGGHHEFLILAMANRDWNRGLRKDDHMKHMKHFAIGTLLLLGVSGAAAQSLGDYARAVRKNKVEPSATSRHYDNDNLPTTDKLSVVGPAADSDAAPTAKAGTPDPAAAAAERQKAADDWKKKLDQQQQKIESLNHELDLDQREYRLRAAAEYSDAGNRLRNAAQWDKDDAHYKTDMDSKQKALDAAKQELDQMQEEARKAGIAEKDKEKDQDTDKAKDTPKDTAKDTEKE